MKIGAYVINLNRSIARWEGFSREANSLALDVSSDAAIIMEDDMELQPDLMERAEAVLAAVPKAELVKLLNHQSKGILKKATTKFGDATGRGIHGPQEGR